MQAWQRKAGKEGGAGVEREEKEGCDEMEGKQGKREEQLKKGR